MRDLRSNRQTTGPWILLGVLLLLGAALVLKQNKAELSKEKGQIFLGTYFVILTSYAIYVFGFS